jgi:hypothetical protein
MEMGRLSRWQIGAEAFERWIAGNSFRYVGVLLRATRHTGPRSDKLLRKHGIEFIVRTIMQPLLFVFVFAYVFPKIGQGIGGAAGQQSFSSLLVPGVVAIACIFQGIQAVALPLVQEFSVSREIEDRVMAPLPVWAVAVGKLVAGALQGLVAAAIVFPLAAIIPATPVHLNVQWLRLVTLLPMACVVGAALGLVFASWCTRLLVGFLSRSNNQAFLDLSLNLRVLAFTGGAAALTALLFGLVPALRGTSVEPQIAMKENARGLQTSSLGGRSRFSLGKLLVMAQVALSLMLLAGAR